MNAQMVQTWNARRESGNRREKGREWSGGGELESGVNEHARMKSAKVNNARARDASGNEEERRGGRRVGRL